MEQEVMHHSLYSTSYFVTNGDWPAIGRKYDEMTDNLSTRSEPDCTDVSMAIMLVWVIAQWLK